MRSIVTDVLIVGAGCGGVAAALACARSGVRCVLTEPTGMIGGQLSSQGVPPDENAWIEGNGPGAPGGFFGCTASYRGFRESVRAWMREHGSLTDDARRDPLLNPGGGWVSRLCFPPVLADRVLRGMLRDADGGRGLIELRELTEVVACEADGDLVRSVTLRDAGGDTTVVRAAFVLDATETGDLYPLAGIEHAIGGEGQGVYGEPSARADLGTRTDPFDQQPCTWCFAVEHRAGEDHTIEEPKGYDRWRRYTPEMDTAWTGRLFDWTVPSHNERGRITLPLVPWPDEPGEGALELWRYRRVVDASKHTDRRADVSVFNCVQMDCWGAPLLGVEAEARRAAERMAREQSLSFLYWMQTEAPRHDGGTGYPGLRLRGEELGTTDGLAAAVYIREPRRLIARTMVTERDLSLECRRGEGISREDLHPMGVGACFADSIAIGHYPIDLHPSGAGRMGIYAPASPFRIPLSSLVPVRVRNVIAAGKGFGVSHIANGATRLHPVEWAVGEAAGVLAARCVREETEPHAVVDDPQRAAGVRERCEREGMPTRWPWEELP